MFLIIVPKKPESIDSEEKIGNEESDLEEACVLPHSPINVDKRPISMKSPKVKYVLCFLDCIIEILHTNESLVPCCCTKHLQGSECGVLLL